MDPFLLIPSVDLHLAPTSSVLDANLRINPDPKAQEDQLGCFQILKYNPQRPVSRCLRTGAMQLWRKSHSHVVVQVNI
jgi:hypothetical protein